MGDTPFQETNALLAVMADDPDQARRILAEMLPSELSALADACDELSTLVDHQLRHRSSPPTNPLPA